MEKLIERLNELLNDSYEEHQNLELDSEIDEVWLDIQNFIDLMGHIYPEQYKDIERRLNF